MGAKRKGCDNNCQRQHQQNQNDSIVVETPKLNSNHGVKTPYIEITRCLCVYERVSCKKVEVVVVAQTSF